ncbi:PA14 domain-containing protein [Deinococcus peraridilitoris]|nr:PA14 domain-containing protein [Deinococcus peraridilitoris]
MAAAMPSSFSRPGAGASRLPLQVTSFDAPGFGELADAINIANGNLYVDVGAASRNTTLQSGDEQQGLFGSQWNLKERLRLAGFHNALALSQAPASFALMSGDGSARSFIKITLADTEFTSKPDWIKRYRTLNSSSGVVFYRSQAQAGTINPETWLVLLRSNNSTFAHLYEPDGTRVTFNDSNAGEYADYIQTLHEQYRSATAAVSDTEGRSSTSPKVDLTYGKSGQLSQTKDAWGRITTYLWNTNDALESIRYQPDGSTKEARKVSFAYAGDQLTTVDYYTTDGFGNPLKRSYSFGYGAAYTAGPIVLQRLTRSVPPAPGQSSTTVTTTYIYEKSPQGTPRIKTVMVPGLEPINYTFTTSTAATGLNAEYFQNKDLAGVPVRKVEPFAEGFQVNWGSGAPEGISTNATSCRSASVTDCFSSRWTGRITAPATGSYTFTAYSDDGFRVWVRGKLVIDHWQNDCCADYSGKVELVANQAYDITVEHFDGQGDAHFRLSWTPPGGSSQLVPARVLTPATSGNASFLDAVKVIVQQGDKRSEYQYDHLGRLRQKSQVDSNPALTTNGTEPYEKPTKTLTWRYRYYDSGYPATVEEPSGRTTHYAYDARGNLTRRAVYISDPFIEGSLVYAPSVAVAGTRSNNLYAPAEDVILNAKVTHDSLDSSKQGVLWRTTLEQTDSNPYNGTGGGRGWGGWWAPQPVTPGYQDDAGRSAYQMAAAADFGGTNNAWSGMISYRQHGIPLEAGRYLVSFNARTVPDSGRAQNLDVLYGLDNAVGAWATLTPKWQRIEQDFLVKETINTDRIFQAGEGLLNNPAWQIADIHVTYLGKWEGVGSNSEIRFSAPRTSTTSANHIDFYKVWAVSKADMNRASAPVTIQVQSPIERIDIYGIGRINVAPRTDASARTIQFGATVKGRDGRVIPNSKLVWSTSGGTISQAGLFTAPPWEDINPYDSVGPTKSWVVSVCSQENSNICQQAYANVGYSILDWVSGWKHDGETYRDNSYLGYRVQFVNPTPRIKEASSVRWTTSDWRSSISGNGCAYFPEQSVWAPGPYATDIRAQSETYPELITTPTKTWWVRFGTLSNCPSLPGVWPITDWNVRPTVQKLFRYTPSIYAFGTTTSPSNEEVITSDNSVIVHETSSAMVSTASTDSSGAYFVAQNSTTALQPVSLSYSAATPSALIGDAQAGSVSTAAVEQEPSRLLKSNFSELENFNYDDNNRLVSHIKPKFDVNQTTVQTDVRDSLIFPAHYQDWREVHTYQNHSVTINGQTFNATKTDSVSTQVGASGGLEGQSFTPGTERRTTTHSIDTFGRVAHVELKWENNTQWRKITFGYPDPSLTPANAILPGVNADGSARTTTSTALQFADLAQSETTSTSDGLEKRHEFVYDAFGSVAQDTLKNGIASDDATVAGSTDLIISRSFNGFGQKTWERTSRQVGGVASQQVWFYAPGGELLSTWTGRNTNQTNYSYNSSGLLEQMQRGIGTGSGATAKITTAHQTIKYMYDTYGRVNLQQELGEPGATGETWFDATTKYDTLDRPVEITLPDGGKTILAYDHHGELGYKSTTKLTQTWNRNPLGRVRSETLTPSHGTALTIVHIYDQFGRLLSSTPTGAEANSISSTADQATTSYRYDTEGNLLATVGPALRTNTLNDGEAYIDNRRPGVAYQYDTLNRRTSETTALTGAVDFDTALTAGQALEVITKYDGLDRPTEIIDNNGQGTASKKNSEVSRTGYKKTTQYDLAGNVTVVIQDVSRSGDFGYTTGTATLTTRTYYDAAGRVLKKVDAANHTRRWEYDPLGNVTAEFDETGKVIKGFEYTNDGLLQGTYEPVINLGGSTSFTPGSSAFNLTEWNVYGNRPYPTTTFKATTKGGTGTLQADDLPVKSTGGSATGGVQTSYTYDYAGRPTVVNTAGRSTSRSYDHAGHPTVVSDADGFVTINEYDHAGRVTREVQAARSTVVNGVTKTNDVDDKAGLSQGLTSTFRYDVFGNLTYKLQRGLITEYAYNSLGNPIRESRPRSSGAAQYKYYAYNLTGIKTAETTFDYQGDLVTRKLDAPKTRDNFPLVSRGSVQVFELDRHGNTVKRAALGANGTRSSEDHFAEFWFNGLDQPVKREFSGYGGLDTEGNLEGLYVQQRNSLGKPESDANTQRITSYDTYWTYNNRALLESKWDTYSTDTKKGSTYIFPEAAKRNKFTYTYTTTGKEATVTRTVKSVLKTLYDDPDLLNDDMLLAASIGITSTQYNERGLPRSITVSDQSPAGRNALTAVTYRTTIYGYYANGAKKTASIHNVDLAKVRDNNRVAYTDYKYDQLGRQVAVFDSNGTDLPALPECSSTSGTWNAKWRPGCTADSIGTGSATTTTAYEANGKRTSTTTWANGFSATRSDTATIGGLPYFSEEARSDTTRVIKSTATYTSYRPDGLTARTQRTTMNHQKDAANGTINTITETNTTTFQYTPDQADPTYYPDQAEYKRTDRTECSSTTSSCSGGYTTTKVSKYNLNGDLTSETYSYSNASGTFTNRAGMSNSFTTTYLLDARGNRYAVQDSRAGRAKYDHEPENYNAYRKRYDADNRVAEFYKLIPNADINNPRATTEIAPQKVPLAAYTEFFYDPQGRQVLSSTSGLIQSGSERRTLVSRETNSTFAVDDRVVTVRKREGAFGAKRAVNVLGEEFYQSVTTYSTNDAFKDEAYTLADGLEDSRQWIGVALFNVPASGVMQPLEAPVEPVSFTVRLDPVSILPPSTTPVSTPAPEDVKTPKSEEEAEAQTLSQPALGITTLHLQALPDLSSVDKTNTSSASGKKSVQPETGSATDLKTTSFGVAQALDAPVSALPSTIRSVNVQATAEPLALSNSLLPNPIAITEPIHAGTPAVGTTPADGIPNITPPGTSDVATPTIPSITQPGENLMAVRAPVGVQQTNVKPLGIVVNPCNESCGEDRPSEDVAGSAGDTQDEQKARLGDGFKVTDPAEVLKALLENAGFSSLEADQMAGRFMAEADWMPRDDLMDIVVGLADGFDLGALDKSSLGGLVEAMTRASERPYNACSGLFCGGSTPSKKTFWDRVLWELGIRNLPENPEEWQEQLLGLADNISQYPGGGPSGKGLSLLVGSKAGVLLIGMAAKAGQSAKILLVNGTKITMHGKPFQKEVDFVTSTLAGLYKNVDIRGREAPGADLILDGVRWELKTLEAATVNAVRQNIRNGIDQSDNLFIDGRNIGLTLKTAADAVAAHVGSGRMKGLQELRVYTVDGIYTWRAK